MKENKYEVSENLKNQISEVIKSYVNDFENYDDFIANVILSLNQILLEVCVGSGCPNWEAYVRMFTSNDVRQNFEDIKKYLEEKND